jgi:hypothetical protein
MEQRLHAARGEVCHGPDGRPHAHEHLSAPGDRQDAEGIMVPVVKNGLQATTTESFFGRDKMSSSQNVAAKHFLGVRLKD